MFLENSQNSGFSKIWKFSKNIGVFQCLEFFHKSEKSKIEKIHNIWHCRIECRAEKQLSPDMTWCRAKIPLGILKTACRIPIVAFSTGKCLCFDTRNLRRAANLYALRERPKMCWFLNEIVRGNSSLIVSVRFCEKTIDFASVLLYPFLGWVAP